MQRNSDALRSVKRQLTVVLSLFVVLGVFWCLKLTGITMAGEAFCAMQEHTHSEQCQTLVCGLEESEQHTHTAECYAACTLEEHVHDEHCYSDINADLETREDWEASLAAVPEQTTTAATLIEVARSQLGTTESERNFEVDLHGVRRGITRYGQWYGNPYGDWSSMFVSFCLAHAGVEDLPTNTGPEAMRLEWEAAGLYQSADSGLPRPGDLIFLTTPRQTVLADAEPERMPAPIAADAVAIITEVTEAGITVIQGDWENAVAERMIPAEDASIMGYGQVPERSPYVMMAAPRAVSQTPIARTISYRYDIFTAERSFVIYASYGGQYYAIASEPASGMQTRANAVPIQIDGNGNIYVDDAVDLDSILWKISGDGYQYVIENVATGRYLHPGGDYGIIFDNDWPTSMWNNGTGAQFVHTDSNTNVGISFDPNRQQFYVIDGKGNASVLYFGATERLTVWLDGTLGNLMNLRGSDVTSYSVDSGSTLTLPTQWKSPDKYSYVLKGWYDVGNRRYYAPGETVTVTENMLFYADWVAETYDVGQMNADVVETVSTNSFITTHMFDYNSLFNTLSMNNNFTGSNSSPSWTMVDSGTVQVTGQQTLNFIFVDHDGEGVISHPIDRNAENGTDYRVVYPGLYNDALADLLFDTELDVVGKQYIGTGDHLFQYGDDPDDDDHYGYYYYDSQLNAASYNLSDGRFYVYDYLERTTDSAGNDSYSDFLPFNSPYANTNGKNTGSYNYDGVNGEYVGVSHVSYDAKYSDDNNSPDRVVTNYAFGMAIEMDFYLPAVPGTVDSDGTPANQSIVGDNMVFEFSGDDDVWVLIDGELVLDIGGIHIVKAGSIDFSTGDVIVDGVKTGSITDLAPGSHKLTMYYLERGSSMSNFKLRFNLSPRYSLTLRKEDTQTGEALNGAQFAVFTDEACTRPAELWNSREDHENRVVATNVFTVENGVASMWGLAAGNTYYLKEIRGPDAMQGVPAQGVIRMRLNNQGTPDYEVMEDAEGNLTVGYTVHGYKVNEDLQEAYLVITNTDATESVPTSVYVEKDWNDTKDHSGDAITVYLVANGVRIQSVTLSDANNWQHTWENLPSTDGNGAPVIYTVQEATVPGYVGDVESIEVPTGQPEDSGSAGNGGSTGSNTGGTTGGGTATPSDGFADGQTYLLSTRFGYLGASDDKLLLEENQDNALGSDATQWVAKVNADGTVTLTNRAGQTLYYDSYTFRASSNPGTYRNLTYADGHLYNVIDYGSWVDTQYPSDNDNVPSNVTYNGVLYTSSSTAQILAITPQQVGTGQPEQPPEEPEEPEQPSTPSTPTQSSSAYRITNTPAGEATVSLRVNKQWDPGILGDPSYYLDQSVQFRLLEDGADAGLIGTCNLRNGWSYTFENLPMYNSSGQEIVYTVQEVNLPPGWHTEYGPVTPVAGANRAYETTVTNVSSMTVELPSTGGIGPYGYMLAGLLIMLGSIGWYYGQRRKHERRGK